MSNTESRNCPQCGAPIDAISTTCKYCGADIAVQQTQVPQYVPQQAPQYQNVQAPQYQPPQAPQYQHNVIVSQKSKVAAGVLAILLGGFGVHKFYLGKIGLGLLYLFFCWTYIPALIGFIEGIIYLTTSEENFYIKYVKK